MKNKTLVFLSLATLLSLGLNSCDSKQNESTSNNENNSQESEEISGNSISNINSEIISNSEESSFLSENDSSVSEEISEDISEESNEEISESNNESLSNSQQITGNAFTSDINSSTQKLLAKTASGNFASVPLSVGTDSSISAKYEVSNNNVVDTVVYAISYTTKFTTIKMYIAVNTSSYALTGYTFDSKITTHNQDNRFTNGSWEIYEDGTCDAVSGSTVSVKAIKSMTQIAINQAKKDY